MSKVLAGLCPQLVQVVLSSTLASSDATAAAGEFQRLAELYARRAEQARVTGAARSSRIRGAVRAAITQLREGRQSLSDRELTVLAQARARSVLGKKPDEDLVREEIKLIPGFDSVTGSGSV